MRVVFSPFSPVLLFTPAHPLTTVNQMETIQAEMPIVVESPTTLNSTSTAESDDEYCCCNHTGCRTFCRSLWCDRLLTLEGSTSSPVDVGALEVVLNDFLPERHFLYLLAQRQSDGVCSHSVLLCVEPGELVLNDTERSQLQAQLSAACAEATSNTPGGDQTDFRASLWSCCGVEATETLDLWAESLVQSRIAGRRDLLLQLVHELCASGFSVGGNTLDAERALREPVPLKVTRIPWRRSGRLVRRARGKRRWIEALP